MHAGISLADVDVEDQIDGDVGKSVTPLDSKHDDESGKNLLFNYYLDAQSQSKS